MQSEDNINPPQNNQNSQNNPNQGSEIQNNNPVQQVEQSVNNQPQINNNINPQIPPPPPIPNLNQNLNQPRRPIQQRVRVIRRNHNRNEYQPINGRLQGNPFTQNLHFSDNAFIDANSLNQSSTIKQILETFNKLFLSSSCHWISFIILIILGCLLYYYISPLEIDDGFILNLESDKVHLWIIVWIFNTMLTLIFWNLYLFIYHSILKYDYIPGNGKVPSSLPEDLYINPLFFMIIVNHLDNSFLKNAIDNSFWMFTNLNYYFIAYHLTQIFKHFDKEMSLITNFSAPSTKQFILKMRLVSILLGAFTFLFMTILFTLIEDGVDEENKAEFSLKLYGKGIYIFLKIIALYFTRSINYYYMQYEVSKKEKYLQRNLKIKACLEIFPISFILYQFLTIFLNFQSESFLFTFVILCLLTIQVEVAYSYVSKNFQIRKYYNRLDKALKKVKVEDEECVICTEKITEARILPCKHIFHLLCITQWMEKGNKTCPICRAEIKIPGLNNLTHPDNERRVVSFGIRLNNTFLSWLPNFSMRIVRLQNGNNEGNGITFI